MVQIGPHSLTSSTLLAPMAGVSDRPFRILCRQYGAALTASEMISADNSLWHTEKSRLRRIDHNDLEPRAVQIAGAEPEVLALAAKKNIALGAQIIDINMGCPAKKVLKRAAGSALLRDELLVARILKAVVDSVDVPVTLKIRTGWSPNYRNGTVIARIAEDCGIAALAVHGRTRECAFKGEVEYDTIAAIKASIAIPVFANGDIDSPEKARAVLDHTKADGVMLGRAAQGRPWIFKEINYYLKHHKFMPAIEVNEICTLIRNHLLSLYQFYGDHKGMLFARKHISWYLKNFPQQKQFRAHFNSLQSTEAQQASLKTLFQQLLLQQQRVAA